MTKPQKGDPPGGTTGRVGCDTGWMRRPCRTQDPLISVGRSVTAGADAAHVVAVSVELANPAAAAIAIVITVVAGGDRTADDGGADDAGSNAPAEAERFCVGLMRGGSERAGGN